MTWTDRLEIWAGLRGTLALKARVHTPVLPKLTLNLAYCPHPVTVYIRGPMKGYI